MELHQLRYFLLVAKHENFSKAAEELYIAQPSVSKAINSLEKELETPLFHRNGKKIKLNEAGKILKGRLQPVIGIIDSLKHDIQMVSGLTKSTIQLNVLAASSLLPDILIKFKNMYPFVDFHLKQSDASLRCDLCICATLPEVTPENGVLVLSEEILLAVPLESQFALKDSVNLHDLERERFISLTQNKALRSIMDHFFELAGYTPHVEFETDSPNTMRDLVRAGLGVTMWPALSWGEISHDKVKLLRIENPVCRRNLFVTWPKGKEPSVSAKLFLGFIRDYFLKMQGLGKNSIN